MTEAEIITLILKGDREKYKLLLVRYQPGLISHCFFLVHDYEVASDLTQEASVKAFFQLKKYNPTYRFSTWLYKIATNLCLDFLKKHTHLSLEDVPEIVNGEQSPEQQLEKGEIAAKLHSSVLKLPITYQSVINLYYWQNYRYEEIAEIMQVPLGTIRTWLRRAKEQLKEDLYERV